MRTITMIQTEDGKVFDTQQEAERHIADKCCEVLDKHLKPIREESPCFTPGHIIEIVEFLMGDYKKAKKLISDLYEALE